MKRKYKDTLKRKFSAATLALLIIFSLSVQAFHYVYHARHFNTDKNTGELSIATYQLSTDCTLCAQILHQGYTFIPAATETVMPPVAIVSDVKVFESEFLVQQLYRSLTNKDPPSLA